MKKRLLIAAVLVAASTFAQAQERVRPPEPASSVAASVSDAARRSGHAIRRGTHRAASAVRRGAHKTASALRRGGHKVKAAVTPAPSPR